MNERCGKIFSRNKEKILFLWKCQLGFSKYLAIICVWPSVESCPSLGHHLNMWFYAADGAEVLHEAEHPTYGWA